MEPRYEVIKFGTDNQIIERTVSVEKRTDKTEDSFAKIVAVSSIVLSDSVKVVDDTAVYGGRVVFFVCYKNEDGNLKKFETTEDFTVKEKIDKETFCGASANSLVIKTDYSFEGGTLVLRSVLAVNMALSKQISRSAFLGGDNVVVSQEETETSRSLGVKVGAYPIEQEFDLNFPVAEVVSQNVSTVITAVQSGVGCIIVDGECYLKLLLLQNLEKGDIIKEEKVIPFRMEIECEDAMPQMQAVASVKEKSLKTDVSVDEGSGKSTVTTTINLAFEGEAFLTESAMVVLDAFSTTENLDVFKEEGEYFSPEKISVCDTEIVGRAQTDELPAGIRILCTDNEKVEIVEYRKKDDGLYIEGVLSLTAYFKDGDGVVTCKKLETPFSKQTDCPIANCEKKRICVVCKSVSARLITLSEIELTASIILSVRGTDLRKYRYVKQVTVLGNKLVNDNAISVYIGFKGEDLFSLAKRLNETPENVLQTNKDLQFPLTGKERIVIYRQK